MNGCKRMNNVKQSSLKTGIQMIFLHIVFWCMDMLFCEDTTKLHIGMVSGMLIILLMITCIVFTNKAACCSGKPGVQGGLLFLLIALSMGINKGIVMNNLIGYILYWILGIAGTVTIWKLKERRKDNKWQGNVVIRAIPITLIPIGGIWGGRLLLKSVGQQKAYWIYVGSGIFIELLLAIVGTYLIMIGICKQKAIKK